MDVGLWVWGPVQYKKYNKNLKKIFYVYSCVQLSEDMAGPCRAPPHGALLRYHAQFHIFR
jgi:hypothetical protein